MNVGSDSRAYIEILHHEEDDELAIHAEVRTASEFII